LARAEQSASAIHTGDTHYGSGSALIDLQSVAFACQIRSAGCEDDRSLSRRQMGRALKPYARALFDFLYEDGGRNIACRRDYDGPGQIKRPGAGCGLSSNGGEKSASKKQPGTGQY
jgi:hypothetical protein